MKSSRLIPPLPSSSRRNIENRDPNTNSDAVSSYSGNSNSNSGSNFTLNAKNNTYKVPKLSDRSLTVNTSTSSTTSTSTGTSSSRIGTSTRRTLALGAKGGRILRFGETVESLFLLQSENFEEDGNLGDSVIYQKNLIQLCREICGIDTKNSNDPGAFTSTSTNQNHTNTPNSSTNTLAARDDPSKWIIVLQAATDTVSRSLEIKRPSLGRNLIKLHKRAISLMPAKSDGSHDLLAIWMSYAQSQLNYASRDDAITTYKHMLSRGLGVNHPNIYIALAKLEIGNTSKNHETTWNNNNTLFASNQNQNSFIHDNDDESNTNKAKKKALDILNIGISKGVTPNREMKHLIDKLSAAIEKNDDGHESLNLESDSDKYGKTVISPSKKFTITNKHSKAHANLDNTKNNDDSLHCEITYNNTNLHQVNQKEDEFMKKVTTVPRSLSETENEAENMEKEISESSVVPNMKENKDDKKTNIQKNGNIRELTLQDDKIEDNAKKIADHIKISSISKYRSLVGGKVSLPRSQNKHAKHCKTNSALASSRKKRFGGGALRVAAEENDSSSQSSDDDDVFYSTSNEDNKRARLDGESKYSTKQKEEDSLSSNRQKMITKVDIGYMLDWSPSKHRSKQISKKKIEPVSSFKNPLSSQVMSNNSPMERIEEVSCTNDSIARLKGNDNSASNTSDRIQLSNASSKNSIQSNHTNLNNSAGSHSNQSDSLNISHQDKKNESHRDLIDKHISTLNTTSPPTDISLSSLANADPDFLPLVQKENILRVNSTPFVKLGVIGKGGSCKVYKALSRDQRIVAIKKVKLAGVSRKTIEGYANEISLLRRLNGNPAIIQLYDSEVDLSRKSIFLVMEVGEVDLNYVLQQHARTGTNEPNHNNPEHEPASLNMNFIRLTWQQMLSAVHCIHEERIIHGDLKPANFLFVKGALKLIDFGIAKAIQSDDTTNIYRESQIGTLNYMSPESILDTGTGINGGVRMKCGRVRVVI